MKIIRLTKDQDIADVIQAIKNLKDPEVVFELEKGSSLLTSSANLKLIKKTGEVMGKKVRVRTDDPTGRLLAIKAEVLDGTVDNKLMRPQASKVRRSDVKPRFSDIVRPRSSVQPAPAALSPKIVPQQPKAKDSSYIQAAQSNLSAVAVAAKPKRARRFGGNFTKYFVIAIVVLVLVVFGLAVLLPQANITVYARSEPVTRDVDIAVDKSVTSPDSTNMAIPGREVSQEVTQTKNFPATGTKLTGAHASGTVVIYNFTKSTLTLKAATTTLVANGKKFLFTKDVTGIRPTAKIGSGTDEAVDPTTLIAPVTVTADTAGADYNLPATTQFSIVNAALGTQNVYAVSDAAFTGGSSTSVKVVSQNDLNNAVAAMTSTIADQATTDLNAQSSTSDEKILSTGISQDILAKTANKNVNDPADNFDMTMIAKISGLAYNESDIKTLMTAQINSLLSSDKYLLPDATDTITASFKSVDIPNGKGDLAVHYETTAAYKVDSTGLPKLLAGKTADEIKEILLSKPEIDRVDVEFSPFFVNKAPKLNGKIYIHSMLSQGS